MGESLIGGDIDVKDSKMALLFDERALTGMGTLREVDGEPLYIVRCRE